MRRRSLTLVVVAVVAVVVGAMLLKGMAGEGPNDPTASVLNGHPRGLKAAMRLLERRGVDVTVRTQHAAPFAGGVLISPPPEAARWSKQEVEGVLALVASGQLDWLVLCDDAKVRNQRFGAIRNAAGLGCTDGLPPSTGQLLGAPLSLETLTGGGINVADDVPYAPLAVEEVGDGDETEPAALVVSRPWGEGQVVAVASASMLANDGLRRADNAAWLLRFIGDRAVTFDEAHHHVRRAEVLEAAFGRAGPQAGFLALLLLIPLALLGLVPRPGDAPAAAVVEPPPAARASAQALASLYARAGLDTSALETRRVYDDKPAAARVRGGRHQG